MFRNKFVINDMRSSLVVFLVALPLCLGIALASNAPLFSGLIAGIVGGIVVGFFSHSNVSVSGPAAGLTVIVASAILDLKSFSVFGLAVLISGLIQIAFGMLKAGKIGEYFPTSVIKGMLAAIGIILVLKQFPHLLGHDVDFMGDDSFIQKDGENTFTEIIWAIKSLQVGAIIIGVLSICIILLFEYLKKKKNPFTQYFPGALATVIFACFLNFIFKEYFASLELGRSHLVTLNFSGGVENFFKVLSFPDWSAINQFKVYQVAFTIALVGSLESLLSIDAADKLDPQKNVTSKDKELLAQGIGNAISGLLGGLPLTAVIVRTSANIESGGRTKLSAILHGIWLLLCVIFIPYIIELIPLSALAAILIIVGLKLTPFALYKKMWDKGMDQFIPFVITILAILFTNLLSGIIIGILVGVFFVIKSNLHNSIVLVSENNDFLLRFTKDVSFFHKPNLQKLLTLIPQNTSLTIDGAHGIYFDEDIIDMLEAFISQQKERNVSIKIIKSSLALHPFFKE